jgi:hypothetical protein
MRFRVELSRSPDETSGRFLDAADVDAIDAIDAAILARQAIAGLYADPVSVWRVISVNPIGAQNVR